MAPRTESSPSWPGFTIKDFTDGTSKVIMAAEQLSGSGSNEAVFPRNIALQADNNTITAIVNKEFATQAEIDAITEPKTLPLFIADAVIVPPGGLEPPATVGGGQ